MKNIARSIKVLGPFICLLVIAPGCSHQAPNAANDGSAAYALLPKQEAEGQFVKDVGNLPIDQRQAYVQSHMDQLDQLKMDPDKTQMDQLNSLMPPPPAP